MSLSKIAAAAARHTDVTDYFEEMRGAGTMGVVVVPRAQPSDTSYELMALDGNTYTIDREIFHTSHDILSVGDETTLYFDAAGVDSVEISRALPAIVAKLLDSNDTQKAAVARRIMNHMDDDTKAQVNQHRAGPEVRDGCHADGIGALEAA